MTWALVNRRDDSYYSRHDLYEGYNARFNPEPRSLTATGTHVPAFSHRIKRAEREAIRRKSQEQAEQQVSDELQRRFEQEQDQNQSAVADDDDADSTNAGKSAMERSRRTSSASTDGFYCRSLFL
ncbi:hypothetical protein POJ06DRAFT_117465 [Lipomyces tetrasporus]|uniref:Uncharacterized protein n=1 Tax=Lipomyces tetrasporus TaxID=54092 RepID=A0AAD7QRD6_9ASCO|nr:uncharacterized protein POJ06DRAFT_117465 [Lipomyces tetrasporus]KAJ8099826.1 hypothetical protein POJ06DRAFT_117465 [Lipomyces tetrasporus]